MNKLGRQFCGMIAIMKNLKAILPTLIVGLCIGLALGVNIGRDKPLLSNPFEKASLTEKIKNIGNEALETSGKALENTGKALQGK